MLEPVHRSQRVKKAITRMIASPKTAVRTIHGFQVTGRPPGAGVGGGGSVARWDSVLVVSVFVIGDGNAPMDHPSQPSSEISPSGVRLAEMPPALPFGMRSTCKP